MSTAPGACASVYSCGSRTSNRRAPPSSALANSSTLTSSIAMRRTLPVSVASGQVGGRVDVAHRGRIDGHLDDIEARHRPAHRPFTTAERVDQCADDVAREPRHVAARHGDGAAPVTHGGEDAAEWTLTGMVVFDHGDRVGGGM